MTKILALLLSALCAVTGIGQSVIGFTEGTPIQATQRSYKFNTNTVLIGGYYGREDELQYAAQADMDFIINPVSSPTYLDTAKKNHIGIIAVGYNGLGRYYGTMNDTDAAVWSNCNYTNFKYHDALWGCDLIDEPDAPSFAPIQTATKAFYDNTTGLIPLVNLFPDYADNDQLGEYPQMGIFPLFSPISDHFTNMNARYKMYVSDYVNTIDTDYICVDIYPYAATTDAMGAAKKTTNSDWIRNLDLLAEGCRETGRDLWVITQAAGETPDGINGKPGSNRWCETKGDISQQFYASLAFGAKALIHGLFGRDGWWDVNSHMIGSDGKPTKTYDVCSEMNRDIKAFADVYGKMEYKSTYLLNSRRVSGANDPFLNCEVSSEKGAVKSRNGLLVGTFNRENGQKGYIIANMEELNNNVTATATVEVPAGKTATLWQGRRQVEQTADFCVTLAPGEGVFVTVQA